MSKPVKVRDFHASTSVTPTSSNMRRYRTASPHLPFSTPRRPPREQDITEGFREFVMGDGTPHRNNGSMSVPLFAEQLLSPTLGGRSGSTRRYSTIEDLRLPDGAIGTDFLDGAQADLYRDATSIPPQYASLSQAPTDNDFAVEDESEASDSSSSLSGLDLGRRITRAVGGALRRRGSSSSSSESDSDNNSFTTNRTDSHKRNHKRSRRARSRGLSFRTQRTRTDSMDSTAKSVGTRRQILPVHREFTLLMPSGSAPVAQSLEAAQKDIVPGEGRPPPAEDPRLMTTLVLPKIISAIRRIRNESGYFAPQAVMKSPPMSSPLHRSGMRHQHKSTKGKRNKRSRLDQLRQDFQEEPKETVKRTSSDPKVAGLAANQSTSILAPKSASDLLGLVGQTSVPHIGGKKHPKQPREFALPPRPLMTPPPLVSPGERPNPFSLGEAMRKKHEASNAMTPKEGCWWLDISCPGWEDLRDLGELLHLHPLTLEDVLQREPREKIDVYDGLGYYFIVFRAIDETYFRYTAPVSGSEPTGGVDPSFSSWSRRLFTRAKSRLRRKHGMSVQEALDDVRVNDKGRVEIIEDRPGKEGLEGVGVGGLNVYLAVFPDGVVSFHFDDISKHTAHVQNRLLTMKDNASADWIAHGLLDSIVDAFFPLVGYIDEEVDIIDSLVADPATDPKARYKPPTAAENLAAEYLANIPDKEEHIELRDWKKDNMESPGSSIESAGPPAIKKRGILGHVRSTVTSPFHRWCSRQQMAIRQRLHHATLVFLTSAPMFYVRFFIRRTGTAMGLYGKKKREKYTMPQPVFDRREMLRRMTEMRRLVTGMTRLLGFKHQVVSVLKRRAGNEGGEVGAYIGDIHDHICMLETSLLHHENVLNHCQSAYISHIGVSFSLARGQTDESILALSIVTIGVMPMQFVVSMFSLNVRVPCNGDRYTHLRADGSQSPFNLWIIIVAVVVLIGAGVLLLVRVWKVQAEVKWSRINALRAGNGPVVVKKEPQPIQRWALKWPLAKKTE